LVVVLEAVLAQHLPVALVAAQEQPLLGLAPQCLFLMYCVFL
jgi:hypothetical protein